MRAILQQILQVTSSRSRRAEGSSLVEFALVAMLFFMLMFGIIDIGRIFFVQMTIQNALRQAGRYAVTGNHLPGTNPQTGSPYTRVESIVQTAKQAAAGIDVNSIAVSSATGGSNSAGGPGDTVTVSLTTTIHLFTPMIGYFFGTGNTYTFTAATTFKNEPFDPSQTS